MLRSQLQSAMKRWRWTRHQATVDRCTSLEQFREFLQTIDEPIFKGYQQWDPISRVDISSALDALGVDLTGRRFLDIGPGFGTALDVARERGASECHFVDYDPFVCAYNRLKGHTGRRMDVRRELSLLAPLRHDFIWLKATFSADRFMEKRRLPLPGAQRYPPLEGILKDLDGLVAEGGIAVFCPHWDHAGGRRLVQDVHGSPVAAILLSAGWRALPWIEGHNLEPMYPVTFVRTALPHHPHPPDAAKPGAVT